MLCVRMYTYEYVYGACGVCVCACMHACECVSVCEIGAEP